jgi:hypothetical protein
VIGSRRIVETQEAGAVVSGGELVCCLPRRRSQEVDAPRAITIPDFRGRAGPTGHVPLPLWAARPWSGAYKGKPAGVLTLRFPNGVVWALTKATASFGELHRFELVAGGADDRLVGGLHLT